MNDEYYMELALAQARIAFDFNEIPVGAVLVQDGTVIGSGFNQPIMSHDPTAHAEVVAIRNAGKQLSNYRLPNTVLYVTVEPCTMCFGSMIHARIGRLVYGTTEPKSGVIEGNDSLVERPGYNHRIEISGGVLVSECRELMSVFFKKRRLEKSKK